jgi:hypothetical protein
MRGALPALTVLFIACFIGIPLGAVSVTDSQGVIYATLGALAVVFVVGVWVVTRRFRRPASEAAAPFEVLAEQLDVRRGEELKAELRIYEPEEIRERIEVGLVCVERYDRPESRKTDDGVVVEERDRRGRPIPEVDPGVAHGGAPDRQIPRPRRGSVLLGGRVPVVAWRVSAREPERSDEDGVVDDPIWVLP